MNNQTSPLFVGHGTHFLDLPSGKCTCYSNEVIPGKNPTYKEIIAHYAVPIENLALPTQKIDEILNTGYLSLKDALSPERNWVHFFQKDESGSITVVDFTWKANGLYEQHTHTDLNSHVKTHGRRNAIFVIGS